MAAHCRTATHQRAGGHAGGCCFGVAANQRTGGDAVPVGASRGLVSGQRGTGLTQASLKGGAWWSVGGHGAMEGVGTAGHCVDSHDVDLGALRGGGSVSI